MKIQKLFLCLLLTGSVFWWTTTPGKSEGVSVRSNRQISRRTKREDSQKTLETIAQAPTSTETAAVQITGVRVNATENGFEIVLETSQGEQLQVMAKADGNTYIGDIPNARLNLPSGNTFRQEKPVAGIREVTVM